MCVATPNTLTQRERDLLDLLAQGLATKAAAASLGMSANTAKTHLKHIHRKLGVTNRVQALLKYQEMKARMPRRPGTLFVVLAVISGVSQHNVLVSGSMWFCTLANMLLTSH
jgi:DNA-binding CsgD family transcriptional regulator